MIKSNIYRPILLLLLLTVLQSYSLTVFSQADIKHSGTFPKSREIYYEAAKEKILGNYTKAIELYKKALDYDPSDAAAMFELAGIYTDQGKIDEALPYAEKAVRTDPSNKWYKLLLVQLYQARGKYIDAGRIIDQLIAAEPENFEYLQDQALNSIFAGDFKNAIKYYDLLEKKLGIVEEISIQKEKIYVMMDKPDLAIGEIKKLSAAYPDETRYMEMLAELYMNTGALDKALEIYQQILAIDPDNPYINMSLSDYYRKQGDKEKSFEYLKAGFANPSLGIDTKITILLAYYSVNEIYDTFRDEAFALAETLVKTHPNDPKAYSIYADLLMQDKRYEEARAAFHKVLTIDSTKYLIWEQLLFVESELRDYQAMADLSTRAINLFPQQPLLYLFAGAASYQLKDYTAAAGYFKNGTNFVVFNDRLLTQFYGYLGDTYFQLNEHQLSDEAYEKVLNIDPANSIVLNNYAYYLTLRGKNLEKAEEMARKAVELDPENGANLDTYGWVLFQLGRYKEAEEWIRKAMQFREESAVVVEHYGDVLWKMGDKEGAVEYWEKAIEAGEGSEFLEKKVREKKYYE
ncbi:MAG: tetratricopeptide repeat protein [Bacteroidales bacterium]|nr:tetratricopeptide repeat protein [Bacteroidales bacterium]